MRRLFLNVLCVLWLFTSVSLSFGGINFDKIDDIVTLTNGIDITQWTISVWIYPVSTGEGTAGRIYHGGTTSNPKFSIFTNNALDFFCIFSGDDGEWTTNVNALTLNIWQHAAMTWAGTNATDPIFYVSGSVVNSTETLIPTLVRESLVGGGFIGNRGTTAATWEGQIAEIAIWNVILTPTEIAQLANSKIKGMPLQIRPANLKGYWPMDDQPAGTSADGDTVRDLSGNGNNGTGNDGANNTGLAWTAESILSYPAPILGGQ